MENESIRTRRVRFQFVSAVIWGGAGAAAFLIREELSYYFGLDPRFVLALAVSGVGLSAAVVLMMYLRGDVILRTRSSGRFPVSRDLKGLFSRIP